MQLHCFKHVLTADGHRQIRLYVLEGVAERAAEVAEWFGAVAEGSGTW